MASPDWCWSVNIPGVACMDGDWPDGATDVYKDAFWSGSDALKTWDDLNALFVRIAPLLDTDNATT